MGKLASVSVSAVTITSPTTADVTYTILVGGTPALPNQPGKAVLQDDVWKVSAESFPGVAGPTGGCHSHVLAITSPAD